MLGKLTELGAVRPERLTELGASGAGYIQDGWRFGRFGSRLASEAIRGLVRGSPPAARTIGQDILRRARIIDVPAPTAGEAYRTRLDAFQASMRDRVPEYELEYVDWLQRDPADYMLGRKAGTIIDTLFNDSKKWIGIAMAESEPGPSAGDSVREHIDNLAACFVGWGLSHGATERIVTDMYDYFQIAIPRVGGNEIANF